MAAVVFLKAGMHVGNTCLTEMYNCSLSCCYGLQNWVMLSTRAVPWRRSKGGFIYLFIYKNILKGIETANVLGVPRYLLASSCLAAPVTANKLEGMKNDFQLNWAVF